MRFLLLALLTLTYQAQALEHADSIECTDEWNNSLHLAHGKHIHGSLTHVNWTLGLSPGRYLLDLGGYQGRSTYVVNLQDAHDGELNPIAIQFAAPTGAFLPVGPVSVITRDSVVVFQCRD